MNLKFLCPKCQKRLKEHPQELPELCFRAYESARYYYHSNDCEQALPKIGCAFEMAGIMMETKFLSQDFASDTLVTTSRALISVLTKMNKPLECIEIYQRTKNLLNKTKKPLEKHLQTKLAQLAREAFGNTKDHLKLVHSQENVVLH